MAEDNKKIEELSAEILSISRNTIIINLRFMDMAISMLELIPVPEIDCMAVDGEFIYYDPVKVIKTFSEDKELTARQYLHMVLHCVFHHFWISNMVNQDYWDLACDIAVEYVIEDLNLKPFQTHRSAEQQKELGKLKDKVKYMTADFIYKYFLENKITEGEVKWLRKIFEEDNHELWYSMAEQEKMKNYASSVRRRKAGGDPNIDDSNGDGNANGDDNENGAGEFDGQSIEKIQGLLDEWKKAAEQMKTNLETFSKQRGDKAGALTQNLREVTREKYDYSEFLKKFSVLGEKMKINDDEFDYIFYSYGLQIYENMPLIEPLEYKEDKIVRELAIVIDTSGSTSGELVHRFLQKTYNILKQAESFSTRFNIHLIQCDAEIQEDRKIESVDELEQYIKTMKIRGMGGTDFRPAFQFIDDLIDAREFTNLKGMIYFTDGYGTFPSKQPRYKTAIVYLDDGYNNPDVPTWVIKLVLQPDDI